METIIAEQTKGSKGAPKSAKKSAKPTQRLPLVFEFVQPSRVDGVSDVLGKALVAWTESRNTEISAAFLWQMARAGQLYMMIAHDGTDIQAIAFWQNQAWPSGVNFRCIAALGHDDERERWVGPFIELGRQRAKSLGATKIVWDDYGVGAAMPEDAHVIRNIIAMNVEVES